MQGHAGGSGACVACESRDERANTQTEGNLPDAKSKPGEVAEQPESTEAAKQPNPSEAASQPKSDGPAAQTGSTPEAAKSAASPEPAQSGSQILINIDKSRQQMTVLVDGIEKYSWPVSTGKYGYSTPSGTFTPTSMNEVWYSKQWDNAPMPHSIFFLKDGHAIHGSHEVKSLGKPLSHGCVRISPDNAAILYDLVKTNGMENTKVVLAGVTPGDESNVPDEPAYSYGVAPWRPGPGYFAPPPPRRGLFGGWFRGPYGSPQGYYRPPRGYYRGY